VGLGRLVVESAVGELLRLGPATFSTSFGLFSGPGDGKKNNQGPFLAWRGAPSTFGGPLALTTERWVASWFVMEDAILGP
jgi:hypothetical protein